MKDMGNKENGRQRGASKKARGGEERDGLKEVGLAPFGWFGL